MLHIVWFLLIVGGIAYAAVSGNMEQVSAAIFSGAKSGVALCIDLVGVLVFWMGIMRIAEQSGVIEKMAIVFRPLVQKLFPTVPKNDPAIGYIVSNVCANVLGLGNAATPFGLKAMEALQKHNPRPQEATPAMCTLLTLNTAGLTIIPTTMIALRMQAGATEPADIVLPTVLATACSLVIALLCDRWMQRYVLRKKWGNEP